MRTSTTLARWLTVAVVVLSVNQVAFAQRTVTLKLNTATMPDTLDASDELQIRGAIGWTAPFTLPDGNVIAWDNATTLKPTNAGGDYWDATFLIPDDSELEFKFYSQLAENDGVTYGWETDPNHIVAPGTGDLDLGLHYWRNGGETPYDWDLFADKPAGTVGVNFRAFFCTAEGKGNGYDPNDATQIYGVRGAPEQGVLDWGNTNVVLTREGPDKGTPGYDLYSGVAYYPESSVGQNQQYKFVIHNAGNVGWEKDILGSPNNNRNFVVPAQDSTIHWVYFGNSAPKTCGLPPQLATVIFSVDLEPLLDVGLFNKARGDSLQVRGGFNGWDCLDPDKCRLYDVPGETIYEAAVALTAFPETVYSYKFFIKFNADNFVAEFGAKPPNGWEEPLTTTGADRQFIFAGDPGSEQLIEDRYNDVYPGNIMLGGESTQVTFMVDMTAALSAADPFDPGTDKVFVDFTGDGTWALLAGIPRTSDGDGFQIDDTFVLTNVGGNVYSGTYTLEGPNYAALQYKYSYGTSATDNMVEAGGTTATKGRRRTRYIQPNPDGSWPATFGIFPETFQPTGTLPYDACNPAHDPGCIIPNYEDSANENGDELPTRVTLGQNYPNPFNPNTSIQYTLDRATDVKLRIFDLLGRQIATLVDATMPANTYTVNFDASKLASGTYLYRIETAQQTITKTMVLLK